MNAQQCIPHLPSFTVLQLRTLARIVQARTGTRGKGGVRLRLKKADLMREIRRAVAHTFPDRQERFADTVQGYLDRKAHARQARINAPEESA